MKYKQMGSSGLKVSVVSHGTWAIGGAGWGEVDDGRSIETIRKAVDLGINLIDTAPVYGMGHAEEIVGKAVKGIRDKVVIATKCGLVAGEGHRVNKVLTPESIRKEVEVSLGKLDTDYIDIYFLHWPDENTPVEESLEEMERLQKEGKIKHIGVSNFDKELFSRSMKAAKIACLQPQLSLLCRESLELIKFAGENGVGVMTYGSLAAGMLTGKVTKDITFGQFDARSGFYPFFREPMLSKALRLVEVLGGIAESHDVPVSSVAISWVTGQPGVTSAIVGASKPGHIAENAMAGNWELSAEEMESIEKSCAEIF